MTLSEPIMIACHTFPTPAKTEGEEDDFDVYWNHLVGEHEVWVPYYEDYVQFWKLGEVVTEADGSNWVLDKHREEYIPVPAPTAAWLRTIRKARYGEREAGEKASMSPETEWGTPPPDEHIDGLVTGGAWSESPVATPGRVSSETAAASAAADEYDGSERADAAEDGPANYSSDQLEYASEYDEHSVYESESASSECGYSDGGAERLGEEAGTEPDSGYASNEEDHANEAESGYAPRTITYEFEIKVEEEDDDYALLHPTSPRPDGEVDEITALMRELGLPDGDAPADVNDSA